MTDETMPSSELPAAAHSYDTQPLPASEPQHIAASEPIKRDRSRLALPLSVLSLLLALALAGYVGWTAANPQQPAIDPARVDALEQQANAMSTQSRQLQQRPIPVPTDLKPIEQRLAALEQRANSPSEGASRSDLVALAGRVDQVTGREDALGTREQADVAGIAARLDTLDAKLGGLDAKLGGEAKLAGQIGGLADRQARTARLQAAASALNAGQALGDLPGAPPTVQRFAQTAPPTQASLRLSFDEAAQAAQLASQPAVEDKPFLDRFWARAQQSVTVRQGDRVLLGDPIAGVLEHSKQALEAGDLAGAVAVLDQLAGPAAAAMANWKANAQALLDARAALLNMARG